jgi:peptidoglycan hydrolase-like amidase
LIQEAGVVGGRRAGLVPTRQLLARGMVVVLVALLLQTGPALPAASATTTQADATALVEPQVTVVGSGYGHGRGMGQYGARGYATLGWSAGAILEHFYQGTSWGTVTQVSNPVVDAGAVRVALRNNDGHPTVLTTATGTLQVSGALGEDPLTVGGGQAVRLWYRPAAGLRPAGFDVELGPGCGGPWTFLAHQPRGTLRVTRVEGYGTDTTRLLAVCEPGGRRVWYPGELRAVAVDVPAAGLPCPECRTVAVASLEELLRGVVPNEMPASWPAPALQAQAVAARSYAMAGDTRHRYADGSLFADTCDTVLCQVYRGRFFQDPGGAVRPSTAASTDAAIAATAGVVRLRSGGTVARTEFSASTGGYSAGGDFPPVPDAGDAVAPNPYHRWTRTVPVTAVDQAYGRGRLVGIDVLARNGLSGPHGDGGRATSVQLRFDAGAPVVLTGTQARNLLGLPSDWFTPGVVVRPEYEGTPEARFIDAAYLVFFGRAASMEEKAYWYPVVRRGERWRLTGALAVSDEWAGREIDQLYTTILGRAPDAGGRAFWLDQVRRGATIETIAVGFYASAEYYARNGSSAAGYVGGLYRDILGRAPDPGGFAYWVGSLDARRIDRAGVARSFYASIESRLDRVARLYREILGRDPDTAGHLWWAEVVATRGDVVLAADLAASAEFFDRAAAG